MTGGPGRDRCPSSLSSRGRGRSRPRRRTRPSPRAWAAQAQPPRWRSSLGGASPRLPACAGSSSARARGPWTAQSPRASRARRAARARAGRGCSWRAMQRTSSRRRAALASTQASRSWPSPRLARPPAGAPTESRRAGRRTRITSRGSLRRCCARAPRPRSWTPTTPSAAPSPSPTSPSGPCAPPGPPHDPGPSAPAAARGPPPTRRGGASGSVDNHRRGLEVPRAVGLDRRLLSAATAALAAAARAPALPAPALAAADGALEALLALGRAPLTLLADPRARPPVPAPRPLAPPRAARGARRRGWARRVRKHTATLQTRSREGSGAWPARSAAPPWPAPWRGVPRPAPLRFSLGASPARHSAWWSAPTCGPRARRAVEQRESIPMLFPHIDLGVAYPAPFPPLSSCEKLEPFSAAAPEVPREPPSSRRGGGARGRRARGPRRG